MSLPSEKHRKTLNEDDLAFWGKTRCAPRDSNTLSRRFTEYLGVGQN